MRAIIKGPDAPAKLKKLILSIKDKESSLAVRALINDHMEMFDMLQKTEGIVKMKVNPMFTMFTAGNLKITLGVIDIIL